MGDVGDLMRICVVGAGLAGSLLAWRLAATPGLRVDLVEASGPATDATAVSGGLVRGFEPDAAACRLAAESLAELAGSGILRDWAGYREIGSSYACAEPPGDLDVLLGEVARCLPGSAEVLTADELADEPAGGRWHGLPAAAVVVRERRAGYLSPDRLRRSAMTDLARLGGGVLTGRLTELGPAGPGGGVSCRIGAGLRHYDAVVLATGRWTDRVLRGCRLPATGYRVKLIEVALWSVSGDRPAVFVDETTGLYGRPAGQTGMLLGVATDSWDVDPDSPAGSGRLVRRTVERVRLRFPGLALGRPERVVAAADCYTAPPGLALRPVPAGPAGLFTFTGGSGGAAKTALAASRIASGQLLDHELARPDPRRVPATSTGRSHRHGGQQ